MNRPELRHATRQQQTMAPRLQRAVHLLQMSSQDFALEVSKAMGRNPFLETEDEGQAAADEALQDADGPGPGLGLGLRDADNDGGTADLASRLDAAAEAPLNLSELMNHDLADGQADAFGDERIDAYSDGQGDWTGGAGDWPGGSASRARLEGDSADDAHDWASAAATLADHLHAQLNVLRLPWRDLVLARAVVESLDDDGYLRCELPETASGVELDPPPELDELQIALRRVQALEPAGVAARSVAECLLLQLGQQGGVRTCPEHLLAERIVAEHLGDLAGKDADRLARRLGAEPALVQRACRRIRALDPRPGWRFGRSDTQYITPDVIVRRRGRVWVATLNERVMPRLKLNETYAQLFHRHRSASHGELAAQLQEARWTLHNVQQRFATILSVAQAIIKRQGQFFDYGPMAMKPMALREIADEVGAHPSTVCRVTNNKFMSTPIGVFELKYFFSRALPTSAGGAASPTAVKGLIRDMIAAEDPARPLSDAQIARELVAQGLPIVRRTVTKYRQSLNFDVAGRRHTA